MKASILLLIVGSFFSGFSQITQIPDSRFEQALIDLGIDSDQQINGQIITADALSVTSLNISPAGIPNYPDPDFNLISDLTGIEAFVNLESLTVSLTMIDNLNLSTLSKLKYLSCVDNMLTSLDISNNAALEYLDITSGGDVYPMNEIEEIDLSDNPTIHTLVAFGVSKINLHNNANSENMTLKFGCAFCFGAPSDYIHQNVCIEVDNAEAAENNQAPYSNWNITNLYAASNFTDDLTTCFLDVREVSKPEVILFPNPISPAESLSIQSTHAISRIQFFDFVGRMVYERPVIGNSVDINQLRQGTYLVKTAGDQSNSVTKLIVR